MEKRSRIQYALGSFLSVVIFVLIYKYTLNQLCLDLNDLIEHTQHAESIYLDRFWPAWQKIPYLFWHLCVKGFIKFLDFPGEEASACTCATLSLVHYWVMFWMMDRLGEKCAGHCCGLTAAAAAGLLSLVQPLYVWWFNSRQYEGQFSINPIFNPTHMAVRPFGLLAFAFGVDLIRRYQGETPLFVRGKKLQKWLYVLFGAVLLLSVFTKPTFAFMLLPAGVLYLLLELVRSLLKKDGSWKKVWSFMWRLGCASIPAVGYVLLSYGIFYLEGIGGQEDSKVAIYPFLTAWHIFTDDVPRSVCQAMSFPLWMLVTNWKYFLKSVEGRLSLLGYAVGTMEFSFIVETGFRLSHLNFAWPMMSGMLLFWVIAGARLVALTERAESGWKNTVIVTGGWILLAIHFFSGLYYINPGSYII